MELQLRLALPTIPPIKGFDLNSSCGYEPKEVLGSDSPNHGEDYNTKKMKKKRSFDDFLNVVHVPQTLPLLFWDSHIINKEDDPKEQLEENSFTINKSSHGDENGATGWPPIKSCRKMLCNQKHCGGGGGGSKSTFVKVKMDGVAIARKVDLSLHHSYETLIHTLVGMFENCQENMKAFKLTYQDKEGDWLLAGGVPWGTFMRSVQRLKLAKNGG